MAKNTASTPADQPDVRLDTNTIRLYLEDSG